MGTFKSQHNSFSCGTYAIINAITALGGETSYDEVKRLAGTSYRGGTTRIGILKALSALDYRGIPYRTSSPDYGWRFARKWATINPLIMLVDSHEHYFVATGLIGDRVIVVDSGADVSGNELGTFSYGRGELLTRWIYRGMMYAIRVSR